MKKKLAVIIKSIKNNCNLQRFLIGFAEDCHFCTDGDQFESNMKIITKYCGKIHEETSIKIKK